MRPNTADAEEILSRGAGSAATAPENRRHAVEIERPDEKRHAAAAAALPAQMYERRVPAYIAKGKLEGREPRDRTLLGRFSKWIKLKIYQFEATYTLTMFSSAEKFVFYSVLFLLTSLTLIACFLYLPHHIAFIANRAWFYANGDNVDVVEITNKAMHELAAGGHKSGESTSVVYAAAKTTATIVRQEL